MDKIEAHNEDSSDSIKEMEPPQKIPPPLIDLTSDDTDPGVKTEDRKPPSPAIIVTIREDNAPHTSGEDNPSHWTDDMIKFYNDEWSGENNFDVARIQSSMDRDPSLWHVSPRDLLFLRNRKIRSKAKCWNCCQYGHTVYHCREKLQMLKCYMCGGTGHMEDACPCSVCLTCGARMAIFVVSCFKCLQETKNFCSRCYLFGHSFINCTDNWRRFHSTIGTTTVNIPKYSAYKAPKELWCCNCATKGHNQINCTKSKNLSYPDTFPYVASYETDFRTEVCCSQEYNEEPSTSLPSTSTSLGSRRNSFQFINSRPNPFRPKRNLTKVSKKKRRKRKNIKGKRRNFNQWPMFFQI